MDKYSIGLHTVNRANIKLGPNTRVVTIPGIMKVVKSMRAQGYIQGVNTPAVVFNTTDSHFQDIDVVRKSPNLIQEIVTTGTLLCDAGQHRKCQLISFQEISLLQVIRRWRSLSMCMMSTIFL